MKIGELPKAAGCKTLTIRFYKCKSLLGTAERTGSNYRIYATKDLERLLFIRNCRSLGLTLQEVERLVELRDNPSINCSDVNAFLDKHLVEVENQMKALQDLQEQLKGLRSRCAVPGASSECGVLTALANETHIQAQREIAY
ncbi:MerR family DNA-binding protein [Noviherbaspirillum sp. CPCC 100848]|uniref:MerR family DNA-binding protein n=1 Tax=Noviherbaspirillum album TaxID=3080276 RepID=A0ABU6J4V7_9BURK|nr:MerR family DNA-binding protein [Noviherbaspirillum sp. CPCC 100848]MEC4718420.1 MerR family DNA-binding protein [Noviherbaspirillum sp. CPCC 100848]